MKKIFNLLLTILAYAPVASISVAAHAKKTELTNKDQSTILKRELQAARKRLMPLGEKVFSLDQAIAKSAAETGLSGFELENSVMSDLRLLIESGVLEIKDDLIISGVGSYGGT